MTKVIKAILLFLFFTGFGLIMQSCWNHCGDEAISFRTDSIQGNSLHILGIDATTSVQRNYIVEKDTGKLTRYDSIGFEVLAFSSVISFTEKSVTNWGVSVACACSPAETYDRIISVKVTSSADYNDQYPAGKNLADILIAGNSYNINMNSISTVLLNNTSAQGNLFYKFIFAPSENRIHNLTFIYTLNNGSKVSTTIKNVYIGK